MVKELGILDKVLQIHGTASPRKREGSTRLIYKNANGISNRLNKNKKVKKAKEIHNNLEVDIAAYNKHRLNMNHKLNINGFNQLFRGREAPIALIVVHNTNENIGRVQEGEMSLIMFGPLTDHLDTPLKDKIGLGQWSVMTIKGEGGIKTRIVCGYNPCYTKDINLSTSYQQQCRYFINHNKLVCPWKKFSEDLIALLTC